MTTALQAKTRKTFTTFAASFLALSIIGVSLAPDAHAGKRERHIAAGVIGGLVGAAIVGSAVRARSYDEPVYVERRPRRVRRAYRPAYSSWEGHVRRCYAAYRSYNERTDTFIGYDGIERRCRK
ncbi:MAG: BA14K family protein [Pseudomonadota bacterium]